MARASIYEFAGGDAAWLSFTTAFHELCLADPELNHPFSRSRQEHVDHLASYLAEVFGALGTPRLEGTQRCLPFTLEREAAKS